MVAQDLADFILVRWLGGVTDAIGFEPQVRILHRFPESHGAGDAARGGPMFPHKYESLTTHLDEMHGEHICGATIVDADEVVTAPLRERHEISIDEHYRDPRLVEQL